jgi:alkylation response protein AidB-like acyl-CoA dehydrogenase
VDFELSDDQEALAEGVRRLCEGRFPIERVRAAMELEGAVDRAGWRELGEAGVFALRLTEDLGGAGLGMADAVLVFEQLGRALVPGPLVATHLAAGMVAGADSGARVVGLTDRRRPHLVEHLPALDDLLVIDDDGVWSVETAGLVSAPVLHPLDPLTPVQEVHDLPRGALVAPAAAARRWRLEGRTLCSALLLGIAGATTDMAVAYAKERVQFDRPIGAFQSVKHILADMLVRTELARASTYAAGATLDDPVVGDPERAVCGAKITSTSGALANSKACLQVFGGIGYTWDVDVHLYLKRAWVLDSAFGGVDSQAEELALAFE